MSTIRPRACCKAGRAALMSKAGPSTWVRTLPRQRPGSPSARVSWLAKPALATTNRLVVGRIPSERQQADRFAEFLHEPTKPRVITSGDGHTMPLVQQPSSCCRPDTAGAAPDQSDRKVDHASRHESSGEMIALLVFQPEI
jgi:hypothetical protein